MNGLSLVGGVVLGQIKRNAIPLGGALVAILIALGLLRTTGITQPRPAGSSKLAAGAIATSPDGLIIGWVR